MDEPSVNDLQDLILVAGHAAFKKETQSVPDHPEKDDGWFLQFFQIGEPPFYIGHIRRGVVLLANNPAALLVFSGGYTRPEAGRRWSEASTYLEIAKHFDWWIPDAAAGLRQTVEAHTRLEEYARDSFENVLFSVCRFRQVVGRYARNVTVVSWAFKRARFDFHRAAIRFPVCRFQFEGYNDPVTPQWQNEAKTLHDFIESRYGSGGTLGQKRTGRNPFRRGHDYRTCQGVSDFFDFIESPDNGQKDYTGRLPWED
jgi:hypothetical protein